MASASDTRFRTLFELASGGMGKVFVAERREGSFRRLYALKRLAPDRSEEDESQAAFLDEARLAGRVTHPNVVSVLDYGVDADGPFLVMDLVEGVSLMRLLKASAGASKPFPIEQVVAIGAQLADALHAAHSLTDESGASLQVVHRDVSPQNVLVGFDGSVRLTDFGIARASERHSQATSNNVLKGKLGYMAPEQLKLRPADAKSDLFALGVVLYEIASGSFLYRGDDAAWRIVHEPTPNLRATRPDAPASLRDLLRRLLAKEPSQRPASASEVAGALHAMHAELVVQHGRGSLAEFVAEVLPQAKAEFQRRIREAETTTETQAAPPPKPKVARGPWLVAGAAVLVAVGLATALAIALVGSDPVAPAATRTEPPPSAPSPPVASPPVESAIQVAPPAEPVRTAEPARARTKQRRARPAAHERSPERSPDDPWQWER